MEEKTGKFSEEIQLDFAFVSETIGAPVTVKKESLPGHASRAVRPKGFIKALTNAQSALLEAPLDDLNEHLLSLFEFCEAAMTRALDLVPLRKGELFSPEEYRSLRGIGQAQWLLNEASTKRERKITMPKGKKGKKISNSEREA